MVTLLTCTNKKTGEFLEEDLNKKWLEHFYFDPLITTADLKHTDDSIDFAHYNDISAYDCYYWKITYFYLDANGWHASNFDRTVIFDLDFDE